jgi:DNA-binding NarL/FixJ family response regulator
MPIRVLLADDSDVMRSAIRRILEEERRIEVVGEAATFAKTI